MVLLQLVYLYYCHTLVFDRWYLFPFSIAIVIRANYLTLRNIQSNFPSYQPFTLYQRSYATTKVVVGAIYVKILSVSKLVAAWLSDITLILFGWMKRIFNVIWMVLEFAFNLLQIVVIKSFKFIARIGNLNNRILALLTRACSEMGLKGEIMLIPIVFTWIGWPFVLAWILAERIVSVLFLIALIVSAGLFLRLRKVIREHWRQPKIEIQDHTYQSYFVANSAFIKSPALDGHGIALEISGLCKVDQIQLNNCCLMIEGDEFWSSLQKILGNSIMTIFKYALYPIQLDPPKMTIVSTDSQTKLSHVNVQFRFGTGEGGSRVKFKTLTLLDKLRQFQQSSNDVAFNFVLDIGTTEQSLWGNWQRLGNLLTITTSASKLIDVIQNRNNLLPKEKKY